MQLLLNRQPAVQAAGQVMVLLQPPRPQNTEQPQEVWQSIGALHPPLPQFTVHIPLPQVIAPEQPVVWQLMLQLVACEQLMAPQLGPVPPQSTVHARPAGQVHPEPQESWHTPPAQALVHAAGHVVPRSGGEVVHTPATH